MYNSGLCYLFNNYRHFLLDAVYPTADILLALTGFILSCYLEIKLKTLLKNCDYITTASLKLYYSSPTFQGLLKIK